MNNMNQTETTKNIIETGKAIIATKTISCGEGFRRTATEKELATVARVIVRAEAGEFQ